LCDVLQERNPAVKQDLPTLPTSLPPGANTDTAAADADNLKDSHTQQNVVLWSKFCIA